MNEPQRLLVVDDDEDIWFLLQDSMRMSNQVWHVAWASSYNSAIELLDQEWDAMALDHHLGDRDGLSLLTDERVRRRLPPVVVLTGFDSPDLDRRALDLGAHELLSKENLEPRMVERAIRYAATHGELSSGLERRAAQLEALADVLPVMSWVVDPHGDYEWDDSVAPRLRDEIRSHAHDAHRDALETGATASLEFTALGRSWDVFIGPISARAGDQRVGSVGTAVESTARRRFERELAGARGQLEGLLDLVQLFALVTDLDGGTRFANRSLLERLGRTKDDLEDPYFLRDHVVEFDDVQGVLAETFTTGEILPDWSNVLRAADGTEFEVRWSSVFLRDEHDDIDAIASVGEDVTRARAVEERLRRALTMESLGQLAGGVAHDFNNFLTVITGHEYALRNPDLDHSQRLEHLDLLAETTKRAAGMVKQLLAFGRPQEHSRGPLSVATTVRDLTRLLQIALGADLRVSIETSTDDDTVVADQSELDQIIMNLAVNSRDAVAGQGHLAIEIHDADISAGHELAALLDPGRYVRVTVGDDGPGVDPTVVDALFDPFVSSKIGGAGTGLGLTTASGTAARLGGLLRLADDDRPGATFELYLPHAENHRDVDEVPTPADPRDATIFVVEDDPEVRALVRIGLERVGYTVHAFQSSREALASVEVAPPALLVSDISTSELSGITLADAITEVAPGTAVLLMSGYDETVLGDRDLADRYEFLAKPFTVEQLRGRVQELIEASRGRDRSNRRP